MGSLPQQLSDIQMFQKDKIKNNHVPFHKVCFSKYKKKYINLPDPKEVSPIKKIPF